MTAIDWIIGWVLEPLCVVAGVVCGIVAATFLLLALWSWQVGPRACSDFGDAIKAPTEYKFWHGCFVTMPDGKVLPKEIVESVMRHEFRFEIKR